MKLTQRQLNTISGLIKEESIDRSNLSKKMYNNRNKSRINEIYLFEGEISPTDASKHLVDMVDELTLDYAQASIRAIDKMIYSKLSAVMMKTGIQKTPAQWMEELEDLDSVYTLRQDLATDIQSVITNYAEKIANAAVDSSESNDSEEIEVNASIR